MSRIFTILSLMMATALATNFVMNVNNECGSSSVFHRDHGYALIGHVIKTLSVFLADCQQACQETLECFSFNYCRLSNGSFVCELNRSNKKQNPGSYVPKEGYQYSESKVCCTYYVLFYLISFHSFMARDWEGWLDGSLNDWFVQQSLKYCSHEGCIEKDGNY